MIKIYTILISLGLNSKEIRQRFNNKQIKINGKPIKDLNKLLNVEDAVFEYDEWVSSHDIKFMKKLSGLRFFFDSFGEMFNNQTNIKSKELEYLKSFLCLETDKKTHYILIKKN